MNEDLWAANEADDIVAEVGIAPDTENVEKPAEEAQIETPEVEAANIDPKKAQTKAYSDAINKRVEERARALLAVEQAKIAQQAQDELVASSPFYNEQGEKMYTKAELDAWKEREAERKAEAEFSTQYEEDPATAVKKLFKKMLEESPELQEAKQLKRVAFFAPQISELNASFEDCGISSLDDFIAHPKFKMMDALMRSDPTVRMKDAYEMVHAKELAQRKSAAAKQAAFVSEASRSHLKPNSSSGGEQVHVPDDIAKQYKALCPKWTDKQIREHYANSQRGD